MALRRSEIAIAKQAEGSGHQYERATNLSGDGGGEAADHGKLFFLEEMRAGAGKLLEGIGEIEFLAAKMVDQQPDNQTSKSVDEGDGGGFDILIDFDSARMQMDVLVKPEEVKEVSDKNHGKGREKRIPERRLENRDGHENVVLAIVAIGSGSGNGKNDVDQNRDASEIGESFIRPVLTNEEPTKKYEMAEETRAHEREEEGCDGSPNGGKQFVGAEEADDNDEIEKTEDQLLES